MSVIKNARVVKYLFLFLICARLWLYHIFTQAEGVIWSQEKDALHFEFFLHKQNLWRLLDTDKAIFSPTMEQNRGNFTKDFTTTSYILESSLNLKKIV